MWLKWINNSYFLDLALKRWLGRMFFWQVFLLNYWGILLRVSFFLRVMLSSQSAQESPCWSKWVIMGKSAGFSSCRWKLHSFYYAEYFQRRSSCRVVSKQRRECIPRVLKLISIFQSSWKRPGLEPYFPANDAVSRKPKLISCLLLALSTSWNSGQREKLSCQVEMRIAVIVGWKSDTTLLWKRKNRMNRSEKEIPPTFNCRIKKTVLGKLCRSFPQFRLLSYQCRCCIESNDIKK